MNQLNLNEQQFKKAALVIRAIKHPLRQKIMQLIHLRKSMTVTDIYVKLKLEQSVVSQQLAILRQTRFVTTARQGKQIYYAVNYQRLESVLKTVRALTTA